jgi:hypothetical protein
MRLRATRLSGISSSSRRLWTPAQLPGLALWLDATDISTITLNGGNVSQWNDKSSNARHATQPNASSQIPYNSTGLNNKPALVFPSASNNLSISTAHYSWAPDRKFANFTVANLTNTTSAIFLRLLNSETPGTTGTDYPQGYMGTGSPSTNFFAIAGVALTTPQIAGLFGAPRVLAQIFGTGGVGADVHGASIDAGTILQTPNCTGLLATQGMRIGSVLLNPFSWRGPIGEVVQVSGDLTVLNRQRVEGYLAHKWEMATNLPANHPFRFTPPTA